MPMKRESISLRIVVGVCLWSLGVVYGPFFFPHAPVEVRAQQATLFDLSAGVRAVGMGGAFVAVADGAGTVLFNPAGLAYLGAPEIQALYELRFGASHLFRGLGALPRWGGGLALFSFGPIEGRNAQDEVTETLGYLQLGLLGAGGWALSDLPLPATQSLEELAIGLKLKLIGVSTVEEGSGGGAALDWGLLLRFQQPFSLPLEELRLGAMGENLPALGTTGGAPRGTFGIAVRPIPELTIALDLAFPLALRAGGEVQIPLPEELAPGMSPTVALRLGGFWEGTLWALTLGFGITLDALRFDYAFQSHAQLPSTHQVGFAWRF